MVKADGAADGADGAADGVAAMVVVTEVAKATAVV